MKAEKAAMGVGKKKKSSKKTIKVENDIFDDGHDDLPPPQDDYDFM